MPNAGLSFKLVNALRSSLKPTRDSSKLKHVSSFSQEKQQQVHDFHGAAMAASVLPRSFLRVEALITSKVMGKHQTIKLPIKLIQRAVLVLQQQDTLLATGPGSTGEGGTNDACNSTSTSAFQAKLAQFHVSLRSVISPYEALDSLLNVWEAVLHYVMLSRDHWKRAKVCSRSLSEIEVIAELLFALIMSRVEFDDLFSSPNSQESARQEHAKHSKNPEGHSGSNELFVLSTSKKRRRTGAIDRECSCEFIHRYVVLARKVLGYCAEKMDRERLSNDNVEGTPNSLQPLITTVLATCYLRLPFLRKRMLEALDHSDARLNDPNERKNRIRLSHQTLLAIGSRQRFRSPAKSAAVFSWSDQLHRKCDELRTITTIQDQIPNEWLEEFLDREELFLNFVAQVVNRTQQQQQQHLQSDPLNAIYHQSNGVPGFEHLLERSFAIIRQSFENQRDSNLNSMDAGFQDDGFESTRSNRSTMSNARSPNPNLVRPLCEILRRNVFLVNEWLLVVFQSTNYMLPHHVTLCLDHLHFIMNEFPSFFKNEPVGSCQQQPLVGQQTTCTVSPSTSTPSTCTSQLAQEHADVSTLRFVFRCLLESEHFEILKSTQLFLLRHFSQFSLTLQSHLRDVLASQCARLLLHWNRDVRFCFGHVLLYLTFPGNRIVLRAASDAALLGVEAEYLFDIPGLIPPPSASNWDAFDKPLCQILTKWQEMNRKAKKKRKQQKRLARARSSSTCSQDHPADSQHERRRALKHPLGSPRVGRDLMDLAVQEYKCLVQTYFMLAKQSSLHEPVPVPSFEIKSARAG